MEVSAVVRTLIGFAFAALLAGCSGSNIGAPPAILAGDASGLRIGSAAMTAPSAATHPPGRCPAWPSGTGLLLDGDFHQAPYPGSYQTYYKGQGFSRDWRVTLRSIDVVGTDFRNPGGICSVDLDGVRVGAIAHSPFPTRPSAGYTVTFLFSGNAGYPTVKTLHVEAAGQSETLQWDTSNGNDAQHGVFVQQSWNFTALSSKTRLVFTSLDPNGPKSRNGPVIAAVSVART
jgi:hypothetical protein